ncbi:MAG: MarR family transcriptional regulator [Amaricoccus sp.]|nr:MarR family transcriptional regulator [Amaricoccus sp.]
MPAPLGFLLTDATRLLRRRFEQASRDLPMTMAQLQILGRLSKAEGIGQAALASLLELEPMTVSRHVDRMEAAGLVERRSDPRDRRARRLYTTEKSRAMMAPMRERAAAIYDQALAGLTEAERAALRVALETMVSNLTGAEDCPGAETAGGRAAERIA